VALSLGSPPPGITWHRVFVEPGLSSLKIKLKRQVFYLAKAKILLFCNIATEIK